MKVKITDPNGVVYAGKILPEDTELEIQKGPHTDAWLRFKQCEVIKEKPVKPEKPEADEKSGQGKKPEKSETDEKTEEGHKSESKNK